MEITKSWNTGEKVVQDVVIPDGDVPEIYLRNTSNLGIWTEPDGRELENLEDVTYYGDCRLSGLIWREEDMFDSITITW